MRISLKQKAVLLIVLIALVLSAVSIYVCARAVSEIIRVNYEEKATNLAHTASSVVDEKALARLRIATEEIYDSLDPEQRVSSADWGSDAFYEYLSHFEALAETEDYKKVHHQLQQIQDANDVDCVYTSFIDIESEQFIYLVDAAHEDPCPIGCFDPVYEENQGLLKDPTIGFPPYTTNTEEYGWLVTSGTPVYSKAGQVICYAMVDISMNEIVSWRHKVLTLLLALQILLTGIVILIAVLLVNRSVVRPINQLSHAAKTYCLGENAESHSNFSDLDIRTHDEIEELSDSMKQMEEDLNDKISNLLKTTNELIASRQEVDKMNEIALKDALTGVHNKHAYNAAMQMLVHSLTDSSDDSGEGSNGGGQFGLAVIDLNQLKQINDTYGHEKGDIAIKELCRIICSVFVHSPVYRIGGDEFAVILKGRDLENVERLMTRFNSALLTVSENADLKPWEQVGASIGYAVYREDVDHGDPEETFQRADRAMYQRKQEMKKQEMKTERSQSYEPE